MESGDLLDRADVLYERYEARDRIAKEVEGYYYDVGVSHDVDSQVYNVRVPEGQYALDLISDLLSAQTIKVNVPAASESQKDRRAADKIEAWLQAWLDSAKIREDQDLVHELSFDAAIRGACVVRVITLPDRLPDKRSGSPIPISGPYPMTMEVRDWLNVYPVYRRSRLWEVFERYEVAAFDLKNDEPGLDVPEEWDDEDMVQVCEWWSKDEKAFWVQGKQYGTMIPQAQHLAERGVVWLQEPTKHNLGCLPYVIRFTRGHTKNRNNPDRIAPSLLQSWRGTLDGLSLAESAKFTAAMAYVNSAWAVYSKDTEFELDLSHGAVNYLRPDEKVEPIVKATMPVDLGAVASEWQQRFQRASVPTALYGENIGPNMAGYAIALLSESGRRILLPIVAAVQGCIEAGLFVGLMQMKELTGPLLTTLGYSTELAKVRQASSGEGAIAEPVKLDFEDVPDSILLNVVLGDPLPQDEERQIGMALQLRQPGPTGRPLMSDETIRGRLKVANNLIEDFRIERERLMVALSDTIATQVAQQEGQIGPDAPDLTDQALQEAQGAAEAAQSGPPQPEIPQQAPMMPPMEGGGPGMEQVMALLQQIMAARAGTGAPEGIPVSGGTEPSMIPPGMMPPGGTGAPAPAPELPPGMEGMMPPGMEGM